ncbi:MAG TPA: DUF4956 domain-containing protein [Longimicrobium sp.]|nr:DUF4956 domain-containing protein [Longimicrobium sp.]
MPRDQDHAGEPVVPRGESETLLSSQAASPYAPPTPGSAIRTPRSREHRRTIFERMFEGRSRPYLRLALYYIVLLAVMVVLVYFVPAVRNAFVESTLLPEREGGLMSAGPGTAQFGAKLSLQEALQRLLTTFLVIAGALSLVIPVAWVYMVTKRFRYDPALVASVIILPIVVAGTALVVRNSLALAFSLAGIVAAVRFRNTLKDPRDAVYIFLVIACGLSAGVNALDVAMAISISFNFVVLTVWKYNIGSLYSGSFGRTGVLSVGDAELLVAETPVQQRAVRRRMLQYETDMRTDGLLLVHSREPDMARTTVQEALADLAQDWRLADVVPRGGEMHTLEYLVRLKKGVSPADMVGALDERWSVQVDAAEYLPFRTRRRKRKGRKGG